MWRQWWRRRTAQRVPVGGDARRTGTPTERAEAVRERLAVLELQRLELLADEAIPGRRHRLDAVRGAARDLASELAELAGSTAPDDGPTGSRPVGSVAGRASGD